VVVFGMRSEQATLQHFHLEIAFVKVLPEINLNCCLALFAIILLYVFSPPFLTLADSPFNFLLP